jgi:hypothetical protein
MNVSPPMLAVLHHTLGLTPERRQSYRNHFVAGVAHHSMPELQALELAGMMFRAETPLFCNPNDIVFTCTDAGKQYALDNLPSPPERTKYQDYCRSEIGNSFSDYLQINMPEFERRGGYGNAEFRMLRRSLSYGDRHIEAVIGDWEATKKAAKASYKAALKASRKNPQ